MHITFRPIREGLGLGLRLGLFSDWSEGNVHLLSRGACHKFTGIFLLPIHGGRLLDLEAQRLLEHDLQMPGGGVDLRLDISGI